MLFKNVKAILDTSKEKEVDVLVARDMLIAENPEDKPEIMKADDFIRDYYSAVTKCRRMGDDAKIEKLCDLHQTDAEAFKALLEEIKAM